MNIFLKIFKNHDPEIYRNPLNSLKNRLPCNLVAKKSSERASKLSDIR